MAFPITHLTNRGAAIIWIQEDFSSFVRAAIVLVLVIAAVIFFFMLVFGGIKWITSGGDKGMTESARNQITAALIGLVVVFSSWAILQIVSGFFGVDIFGF